LSGVTLHYITLIRERGSKCPTFAYWSAYYIPTISARQDSYKCCRVQLSSEDRPEPSTWTTDDAACRWITGVMSITVRVFGDTVDWTVRRVVVGVTVQLVSERQTGTDRDLIRCLSRSQVSFTYCSHIAVETLCSCAFLSCSDVLLTRFYTAFFNETKWWQRRWRRWWWMGGNYCFCQISVIRAVDDIFYDLWPFILRYTNVRILINWLTDWFWDMTGLFAGHDDMFCSMNDIFTLIAFGGVRRRAPSCCSVHL